jgi:hypothetical protein
MLIYIKMLGKSKTEQFIFVSPFDRLRMSGDTGGIMVYE